MYTGSYVFSGPVHVRLSLRPTRKAMPALSTFRSQDRSLPRTVDSIFNLHESPLGPLGKRSARQDGSLFGYFRIFPLQAIPM